MFFKERDPEIVEFEEFLRSVKGFIYPKLSAPSQANAAHELAALVGLKDTSSIAQMFNDKVSKNPQYLQEKDENGATPLHVAAFCLQNAPQNVSLEVWSLLLDLAVQQKFDFNSTDNAGRTLLHLLAQSADANLIKDFLQKVGEVNLEAQDKNGLTPLQTALVRQNFAAAKELVRQGAFMDNKGGLPYSPQEYLQHALTYSRDLAQHASNAHDKKYWLSNVNKVQEKMTDLQQARDDHPQVHA